MGDIRVDIDKFIDEEIQDFRGWFCRVFPLINLKTQYDYKVLVSRGIRYKDRLTCIEFISMMVFSVDTNYMFVLDTSFTKPYPLDSFVEETPKHFVEVEYYLDYIVVESILEFIEPYSCTNPILLISLSLEYTGIFNTLTSTSNFERVDNRYERLIWDYTLFSIPTDKALKDLYELYND